MVDFIIILAIILFIFIFLYGFYLYIKKTKKFKEHKSFIEYVAVFIAIILTLITIYQANSSIENSTTDFNNLIDKIDSIIGDVTNVRKNLDTVGNKLSELPIALDTFSTSITSLNSIISVQKNELSHTLSEFNTSIHQFKSSVDSLVNRFNRKPILEIDYNYMSSHLDTSLSLKKIIVKNKGNLLAEIYRVKFYVSKSLISFNPKQYTKTGEVSDFYIYECDYSPQLQMPANINRPLVFHLDVKFKYNPPIYIRVIIYYRAAFGNDGEADYVITFSQ